MNFPLPQILTKDKLPVVYKYISIPEYTGCFLVSTTRSVIGDFNSRRVQGGAILGEPIELEISNTNSQASMVEIYPINHSQDNFGNVNGVSIISKNLAFGSFELILKALCGLPMQIGMFRVSLISGDQNIVNGFQLLINSFDNTGIETITPFNFRITPHQFYIDTAELIVRGGRLSFNSKITFALPANTTIVLEIFPENQPNVNMVRGAEIGRFLGSNGFTVLDDSARYQGLEYDNILSDELESVLNRSSETFSVISQRNALKKQSREERKRAKVEARLNRKHVFLKKEQEFELRAVFEFNISELKSIAKLKNEHPMKYRFLVLNYDFNQVGSNLSDYL